MKENDINLEVLKKLVRENPNNYSLGEVIRKLVTQIEDEQQTNSLGKNDN